MPLEAFVACVRRVSGGEQWPADHGVGHLVGKLLRVGTALNDFTRKLTLREAEIARLAIQGISTKDIATRLGIKQGTVKIHLHSIYEKLNVGGRLGLMLLARRHGVV
jgi:DNA-binding NarL/FixJ family response regulator